MARKKKKPAADASAEAGESGETPDAETVEPSVSGTDVVTRTLAPIHARHARDPSEVHLSLEPDGVGSADPAGSRAGSSADATPTRARDPEPASVEDVALELRTPEGDGETTTARGGVGDPSDDVSADARVLRFALPSEKHVLGLPVGQHVRVSFADAVTGDVVTRPYTPITSDDDLGFVDFCVKVYDQGVMTRKLDALKPGDEMTFEGPVGSGAFCYHTGPHTTASAW